MKQKGRSLQELEDNESVQDPTIMVEITEHFSHLDAKIQGRNKLVIKFYDCIRAFKMKLLLLERQLQREIGLTFQPRSLCRAQRNVTVVLTQKYTA